MTTTPMAMTTLGRIANFTNDDDDDDDSGAQGAIFPNAGTRKVLSSLGHWFLFFRLDGRIFGEIFICFLAWYSDSDWEAFCILFNFLFCSP